MEQSTQQIFNRLGLLFTVFESLRATGFAAQTISRQSRTTHLGALDPGRGSEERDWAQERGCRGQADAEPGQTCIFNGACV